MLDPKQTQPTLVDRVYWAAEKAHGTLKNDMMNIFVEIIHDDSRRMFNYYVHW